MYIYDSNHNIYIAYIINYAAIIYTIHMLYIYLYIYITYIYSIYNDCDFIKSTLSLEKQQRSETRHHTWTQMKASLKPLGPSQCNNSGGKWTETLFKSHYRSCGTLSLQSAGKRMGLPSPRTYNAHLGT